MRPLFYLLLFAPAALLAADLVRDGKPASEIILPPEPLPQVRFAAQELQDHLEKISGAVVPIVNAPSGEAVFPIYVGEREETRALGVLLEKLPMEGYRVVANDKALILAGRDASFPAVPPGFESPRDVPRLTQEWQEYTGKQWTLPRNGLYDPRNFSPEHGFSLYDPTGTLFAVYDLLEQLGVRWYSPQPEIGTVIPERKTIRIGDQDRSSAPVFARRFMRWTFPAADPAGFVWFKRQKLGMSEMVWFCHGTLYVTELTTQSHPEFIAQINGRPAAQPGGGGRNPVPRLGPPLRDEMIAFADKFFQWCPQLNTWPAAPSDGFVTMDERDRAAGWDRPERGPTARFSDYIWAFVNEVAKGVEKKHPGKIVMGLAYGHGRGLPEEIAKLHPNVGVVYCQTRAQEMVDPARRAEIRRERNEWIARMGNAEFYIWEYYLTHEDRYRLPGVPAVFTRIMQEEAQDLRGKSRGEYVECSYGHQQMRNPALNHYPYLVQARLYWNPDLDLAALLDEYCRAYYGPAAEEMKAFLTFAEEVWMRPAPRTLGAADSFLQPDDVERFFALLAQAKTKAGSGIYAQRVAALEAECEPMRAVYAGREAFAKGVAAAEAGDGDAAARYLEAAVNAAPDAATRLEALVRLAEVLATQQGDREAAIARLAEALALSTGKMPLKARQLHKRTFYRRVALLREEMRLEEARAMLESLTPEEEVGYWRASLFAAHADVSRAEGDFSGAQTYLLRALEVPGIEERWAEELRRRLKALDE